MQSLTPDNLQLALTTPDGSAITVVDYGAKFNSLPTDELVVHASEFIKNRRAKLDAYVIMAFSAMLELGAAYELMFVRLPHGEYERFVTQITKLDLDTVRNYRNVYRNFADLLRETPETALQNLNWRILYRLATRTVAVSCREWFISFISSNPDKADDERLVEISRYLPVELRTRLDSSPPELNIEQAYSLALAYKSGLDGYIYRLVIEQHIKSGYVATELNRLYLEMSAVAQKDKDAAAKKSFADIMRNGFCLVWIDDGGDNQVALADASQDTMIRYLSARRRDKLPKLLTKRATGKIHRIGNSIYLKIPGSSTLPLDYVNGDEIQIDLIIKDKERQ